MMRTWLWLGIVVVMVLTGCAGNAPPDELPEADAGIPVVTQADDDLVLAEAVVEAAVERAVSLRSAGTVLELQVSEGDVVAAGDVLLRLDPTDAALAVDQAEASLAQAEAQLARLEAGPREVDLAVAEAQVATTTSVVTQTMAQRDRLYSGSTEAQIAAAEADLAAARAQELVTRIAHDRTMECQRNPDTGEEICPGLGPTEEQARFAWHAAQAGVTAAEAALESLRKTASADVRIANTGVEVARAQEAVAEVQLAQLEAGAAAEEIAAARAAMAQAQTSLDMARVALERMDLTAPIAGTVTQITVEVGDQVAPGQVVVHLATLDAL
jgi:membrane fusion protein, multidrug efflux system